MSDDVNLYIGQRLRRRRRLISWTQQQLAEAVGIRFQQIQKYECGANRISAARLWQLAEALEVPINYFYDGLKSSIAVANAAQEVVGNASAANGFEAMKPTEAAELVRVFSGLPGPARRHFLRLAKVVINEAKP